MIAALTVLTASTGNAIYFETGSAPTVISNTNTF